MAKLYSRCELFITLIGLFIVGRSSAITVQIFETAPAVCTYATGGLSVGVSGGTPPYSIQWSTGATTTGITDLVAGAYSVTVTDDLGEEASANYTLTVLPLYGGAIGLPNCPGGLAGSEFRMLGPGGMYSIGQAPITINGPYVVYDLNGNEPWEQGIYIQPTDFWPAPGTTVNLPFTDATGCPGNLAFTIPAPPAYPEVQILAVEPSCPGSGYGGVTFQTGVSPNQDSYYIELFQDNTSYGILNEPSNYFGQQAQTITLDNLSPGDYGLRIYPRYPYNLQWMEDIFSVGWPGSCADTVLFTVPAMTGPCATLRGTVYMDDNQNCVMAAGEVKVPQSVITVDPGGFTALTGSNGYYQVNLPTGSYTVTQTAPDVAEHCFGTPIPANLPSNGQTLTLNIGDTALVARDVEIAMNSGFARPGFAYPVWIGVEHNTPGATGTVSVTCTFDPALSYTSANPAPSNVTGNTITWTLSQITSFGSRSIAIEFQVPPNPALLGTQLQFSATVGIVQPEPDLTNNTTTHARTVTGSYDPNDKTAVTSSQLSDALYFIDQDEWINYTIRFQNTGTDTAFNVVITDTLPPTLDPASFDLLVTSHSCTPQFTGQGVLRFLFPNIQLPDSNANELRSHGLVQFRIRPRLPLVPGTVIENIANIYFDLNPPVITEPSVLVAEFSTGVGTHQAGVLRIHPNPANDRVTITAGPDRMLRWCLLTSDARSIRSGSAAGEVHQIDLEGLGPGSYIVQTESRTGTTLRALLIKQ